MGFAEVAVEARVAQQTFSYSAPKGLGIIPGQLVWVPFGSRILQGIVFHLAETPSYQPTKDIAGVMSAAPLLTPAQLSLATWLSEHYLCSLFTAASLMLPPDFRQRILTHFSPVPDAPPPTRPLTKLQDSLLRYICRLGTVELRKLQAAKGFRKVDVRSVAGQLVRKGLLLKTDELEKPRVGPKTERFARLVSSQPDWEAELGQLKRRGKAPRQADLLEFLAANEGVTASSLRAMPFYGAAAIRSLLDKGLISLNEEDGTVGLRVASAEAIELAASLRGNKRLERFTLVLEALRGAGGRLAMAEILKLAGASMADLEILKEAGLIAVEEEEVFRDPLASRVFPPTLAPELTSDQEQVWHVIEGAMAAGERPRAPQGSPSVFLLHGVTGSGKTEIYLRALSAAVKMGKRAIVMVPEIALTPQTVGRFLGRFSRRVAVLHSRLSSGEQYDEWRRIKSGEFDVVIGSRSAIFAPIPDLGLIVLDEEHEWTYKQADPEPRYHARDAAIELARLTGAFVILGSATPDISSYHGAETGDYRLVQLQERITSSGWASEPVASVPGRLSSIEVVDLRQELRAGNRSIFSRALVNAAHVALAAHEQVILFLNRRGTSTMVMCRDCGFVVKCRRCDMALTFHSAEDDMVCHLCNYRTVSPEVCPSCWSPRIRYLGVGTQRVEEEARKVFPEARLLRWDRDAARGRGAHERILDKFTAHEADILIGTQMIAKGLDLPSVTLVGIVCADIGLHLPDFRASEHTFQVLTQVAGRAGRGVLMGRTIIQTYSPDHYAIVAASRQDFDAFYRREVAYRREHGNPPFNRLVKLTYAGTNNEKCQREAQRVCKLLRNTILAEGLRGVSLIGPAPAYISRLRGRYRWQVIVRGPDPRRVVAGVQLPSGWSVDIDPISLL